MKVRLIGALALSLALSQFAITTASAEQAGAQASHFRTVAAQTFSANDLQRYGLDAADAAKVADLQAQGYRVQLVTPEQAAQYHGGMMSQQTWWIIGGIVLLVVIVAAAN